MQASTIKINTFKQMAMLAKDAPEEHATIRNKDLTETFLRELKIMAQEGEPINIGVLGGVGLGKSTVGIYLCYYINKLYKKEMSLQQIASDELDLMDYLLEGNREKECILVDELNNLASTGLDSSTHEALLNWYSNICAQKYVARINANPSVVADINCNLILTIIAPDKTNKETHALLSWRENEAGTETITLLGFVRLPVGQVLETKLYEKYREKKMLRMDLVLKEGIRTTRELKFAKLVYAVYLELKDIITRIKINGATLEAYIDDEARKQKGYHSIITIITLSERAVSILDIEKECQLSAQRIEKFKMKGQSMLAETELIIYKKLLKVTTNRVKELEHLMEINEKYNLIWKND